ncbi:MAG: hypothetical protein LBC31_03150 [Treponema sp.]|jgi:hypothetical protein|nr:hypothetical protein [Treponema sp.]
MNKKVIFPAMLAGLLALSLAFVSCDNGTTKPDDGPNVFTITGITTDLKNYSEDTCIVGMYPEGTTVAQALSDTKRFYGLESGSLQYAVAGREVYHSAATGPTNNWTESDTLKSASSNFTQDWRGSGTFTAYWLLRDIAGPGGTYRAYKLKTARTISEGEHTTVHAVNDFDLVLTDSSSP